MRIGLVSEAAGNPNTTLDGFVAEVKAMEDEGFAFVSVPNIFGLDAITLITLAGRETSRIELATGVVPTPPRHPMALAQQALTAQVACGGRFTLGVGLSHQLVIENMMGLSYARPARQMRQYLEALVPLLAGKPAATSGDIYRVNGGLQVPGAPRTPVLVAALGPLMLKVAGELAEGTSTWMTGPRTLADHTVPTLRDAAAAAGRPEPRILAAVPIALASDASAAREKASRVFQIYGTLPSYRAMLDREGVEHPGDIAIVGDEATLRQGVDRLRDAGVTDFAASLYPAEDGAIERTRELLRTLL